MLASLLPDSDLAWALVLQAILCLAVYFALRKLGRRWSPRKLDLTALAILALLLGYLLVGWDRVWTSHVLPLANLIILGNAFPVLTAMLAAIVSRRPTMPRVRRSVAVSSLGLTGGLSCCWPVLGRTPLCDDRWLADGTCVQTTRFTCSPACAATLLRCHGIAATEQEMADLCLTRHGTTWLGLYRGLKKKTAGTAWDVEFIECGADELPSLATQPMILRVGLERYGVIDASLATDMGWRPGLRHSVVLRRFLGQGFVQISDPAPEVGEEIWSTAELKALWQGQAVRLVRRSTTPAE